VEEKEFGEEKQEEEKLPEEASPSEPTEILKEFEQAFETLEKEAEKAEEVSADEEELPSDTEAIAEILKEMKSEVEIEVGEEKSAITAEEMEAELKKGLVEEVAEKPAEPEEVEAKEAISEMPTVEAPISEMPTVEAPQPYEKREEPVAEVPQPAAEVEEKVTAEAPAEEPFAAVDSGKVLQTLEAAAPVESVDQLPPGAKYRRISKDDLVRIVTDLVREFGKSSSEKLLVQMTERDLRIDRLESMLKEKDDELLSLKRKMEELERQATDISGIRDRWLTKEEEYLAQLKERDERIAGLERALKAEDLRGKLKQLEEEVILLRGRVQELQKGFEFVGFVEEFDVGAGLLSAAELQSKLEELLSGVGEHTAKFMPARVREKLELITHKASVMEKNLQEARRVYSELVSAMEDGNGSISVVVDIASLAAQMKGLTEQLHLCHHILELVEAVVK